MIRIRNVGNAATTLVLLVIAVSAGFYLGRREQPPSAMSGKILYERYCASCHGSEGKGDGPVAEALRQKLPDLTQLQARLGSAYSLDQLMTAIDGRRTIRAHGTSAMPVWGEVFEQSLEEKPHTRRITLLHLQTLAEYLQAIQSAPGSR